MEATFTAGPDASTKLPLCVVYGNCQADALRQVLGASPAFAAEYEIVGVPPVHAITADELSDLRQLVARASLILTQPVRRGYREMALGTEDITAAASGGCRVIRFPVLFYQALYPFQRYVHIGRSHTVDAPMTEDYNDLRIVHCAAQGMGLDAAMEWLRSYVPEPAALREIAATAVADVRERERGVDVTVFDRLTASPASHVAGFFTVNHPTRHALRQVSEGIHRALGIPFDDAGTEEPLDTIKTPLESPVLAALGLPGDGTTDWVIHGERVPLEAFVQAHLGYYRRRPEVLAAAVREYGPLFDDLGFMRPAVQSLA